MNTDWIRFLESLGAHFNAQGAAEFGNTETQRHAADEGVVMCDLSHRSMLSLTGDDGTPFLQGQLTCDVEALEDTRHTLGAHCDHKGRVLTLYHLWRDGPRLLLTLPATMAEEAIRRLSLYILRADVRIADISTEVVRLGVAGPQADALVATLGCDPPPTAGEVRAAGDVRITRLLGDPPRFELHVPADAARALGEQMAAQAQPAGAAIWDLLAIRAAEPEVFPATRGLFTPQMLNLEVLGGVSFSKGCYTGQEVVARTQHLGKIKRRTYVAQLDTRTPPPPGTELVAPDGAAGQGAGRVVMAAPAPEGGCEALIMAQTHLVGEPGLALAGDDAVSVKLKPPPYSLVQIVPGKG